MNALTEFKDMQLMAGWLQREEQVTQIDKEWKPRWVVFTRKRWLVYESPYHVCSFTFLSFFLFFFSFFSFSFFFFLFLVLFVFFFDFLYFFSLLFLFPFPFLDGEGDDKLFHSSDFQLG